MSADRVGKLASIGKYRIIRELGRGGMGVVYLAEDTRLQRRVALKILHPFLSMDEEFVRRFTSEAQAIAALTHHGIVRVHAFEEVDGSHLIDMEYIEGGSLDCVLAAGACSLGQALAIMLRVLEALAACHAQGIIHRDIKPSNILMASDGRVLLSDFGLARSCALGSSATATSSGFIGTPKYAAPESWGKSSPTPAGDVYSAGLVFIELLAGRTPFDGDSPLEIMRKMVSAPVIPVCELLPQISIELAALLRDMLEPDPARRIADAGAVLTTLRVTTEYHSLPHDNTETLRITPPRLRRRSRKFSRNIAAVFALPFIAAGILAFWRAQTPREHVAKPSEVLQDSSAAPPPGPDAKPIVNPGPGQIEWPNMGHLATVGNYVTFTATENGWRSLWSYDTTTGAAKPLWPALSMGPGDGCADAVPVAQGIVIAVHVKGQGGILFGTDGTPEGTAPLLVAPHEEQFPIGMLGSHGGKCYFNITRDEATGIWETDGTLEGTRHRWGGVEMPTYNTLYFTPSGDFYIHSVLSATLYHGAPDASSLTPIYPNGDSALRVTQLAGLGGRVLAEAEIPGQGRELYIGDAALGQLQPLYDFSPGRGNGVFEIQSAPFRDGRVFAAITSEHGRELWFTDGTEAGTRLVRDINPGPMDSKPYRLTESGGLVYFSALSAEHGQELWVTDGTTDGTRRLTDINPGTGSTDPFAFCPFREGLLFTPNDPIRGDELWFTDGTPEGTRMVHECMPGPKPSGPYGTVVMGARAIFGADHPDFGRVLWETDGTSEGTRVLLERVEDRHAPAPPAAPWAMFQGCTYIVNTTPETGAELWVTGPGFGESRLLRDIYPGPVGSSPHNFLAMKDHLYFAADDGVHGIELWRTDGTLNGTALARDSYLGPGNGSPTELIRVGPFDFAYTAYLGPNRGYEIVRYDANTGGLYGAAGTARGEASWKPTALVNYGDAWVYFSSQTGAGPTLLWRTDGGRTERVPGMGIAAAEE